MQREITQENRTPDSYAFCSDTKYHEEVIEKIVWNLTKIIAAEIQMGQSLCNRRIFFR